MSPLANHARALYFPKTTQPALKLAGLIILLAIGTAGILGMRFVAAASVPDATEVWTPLRTFDLGGGEVVNSAAFTPDGSTIVTGGSDGLTLWNVHTGQKLRTFDAHNDAELISLAIAPDGNTILAGYYDSPAILWT